MQASWNSPSAAGIIFARFRQHFSACLNHVVDDGSKLKLTITAGNEIPLPGPSQAFPPV
jgi:hypothetical protein